MIAGVADTHTALWYLLKNPRLSNVARDFIDAAASAGQGIALSPVSLAEIVYLIEKRRIPPSAYDDLRTALADPEYVIDELRSTALSLRRCEAYPARRSPTCLIVSSPPQQSTSAFL